MKYSNNYYFVEVQEENNIEGKIILDHKMVPHTKGTKHCEFLDRKRAIAFRDQLKAKHPDRKFRYVKKRVEHTEYAWV